MAIKSGPEIPPWVAIVVIVLVVAVAGAFIWRGTGKKRMSADQMSQMKQIMEERGMGLAARRNAPMARPGASSQYSAPPSAPR